MNDAITLPSPLATFPGPHRPLKRPNRIKPLDDPLLQAELDVWERACDDDEIEDEN